MLEELRELERKQELQGHRQVAWLLLRLQIQEDRIQGRSHQEEEHRPFLRLVLEEHKLLLQAEHSLEHPQVVCMWERQEAYMREHLQEEHMSELEHQQEVHKLEEEQHNHRDTLAWEQEQLHMSPIQDEELQHIQEE